MNLNKMKGGYLIFPLMIQIISFSVNNPYNQNDRYYYKMQPLKDHRFI